MKFFSFSKTMKIQKETNKIGNVSKGKKLANGIRCIENNEIIKNNLSTFIFITITIYQSLLTNEINYYC